MTFYINFFNESIDLLIINYYFLASIFAVGASK